MRWELFLLLYYPETLAKRIHNIYEQRERFTLIEGDAFDHIGDYQKDENAAFFVDPPYTVSTKKAGKRLYQYNELDHVLLFEKMSKASGSVLLTYRDDVRVTELATDYGFELTLLPMKGTLHEIKYEAMICKDVSWVHEEEVDPQLQLF